MDAAAAAPTEDGQELRKKQELPEPPSPMKTISENHNQQSNQKVSRLFDKNASIRRKQIAQKSQSGMLGQDHANNISIPAQQIPFSTPKKYDEASRQHYS